VGNGPKSGRDAAVNELRDVIVVCRHRLSREIIYTHEEKYLRGPQLAPPDVEKLKVAAKNELSNRDLAYPPYDDVDFSIEWH
jgi:hypothetical protein